MNKMYWDWLIAKVEKRLTVWCNRWFSSGGRLVLVKSVIEVISVYWMSLVFILKVFLEENQLQVPLVRWQRKKRCPLSKMAENCTSKGDGRLGVKKYSPIY
jgi:hypothetical protein